MNTDFSHQLWDPWWCENSIYDHKPALGVAPRVCSSPSFFSLFENSSDALNTESSHVTSQKNPASSYTSQFNTNPLNSFLTTTPSQSNAIHSPTTSNSHSVLNIIPTSPTHLPCSNASANRSPKSDTLLSLNTSNIYSSHQQANLSSYAPALQNEDQNAFPNTSYPISSTEKNASDVSSPCSYPLSVNVYHKHIHTIHVEHQHIFPSRDSSNIESSYDIHHSCHRRINLNIDSPEFKHTEDGSVKNTNSNQTCIGHLEENLKYPRIYSIEEIERQSEQVADKFISSKFCNNVTSLTHPLSITKKSHEQKPVQQNTLAALRSSSMMNFQTPHLIQDETPSKTLHLTASPLHDKSYSDSRPPIAPFWEPSTDPLTQSWGSIVGLTPKERDAIFSSFPNQVEFEASYNTCDEGTQTTYENEGCKPRKWEALATSTEQSSIDKKSQLLGDINATGSNLNYNRRYRRGKRHQDPNSNVMSHPNDSNCQLDLDRIMKYEDTRTTLMIKNIPNKYTQRLFLQCIHRDFGRFYDFFYMPIDFKNKCNVGYAFMNFIHHRYIASFFVAFHGRRWDKFNSRKVCELTYGRIQGKKNLMLHFLSSSVMHLERRMRPIFKENPPQLGVNSNEDVDRSEEVASTL